MKNTKTTIARIKLEKSVLPIAEDVAGNAVNINVFKYKATVPGPRIYIQGGMHGGEVTYWIFHELNRSLMFGMVKGEVVLVPVANPVSWQQRAYFYTFGKNDLYMGVDWNRNFPGDAQKSLGERIAAALFREAKGSALAIDLHTSRKSFPFGIFFSNDDIKLAKTTGLKYNLIRDMVTNPKPEYDKTFSRALMKAGTRSFTLECGSHDAYEPEYVKQVVNGLKNILWELGLFEGSMEKPAELVFGYDKLKRYYAPQAGFVKFVKNVGDDFNDGDLLFEVFNDITTEPVKVLAEEDGVLEKVSPTHIYRAGDEVMEVIPGNNIFKL